MKKEVDNEPKRNMNNVNIIIIIGDRWKQQEKAVVQGESNVDHITMIDPLKLSIML